MTPKTESGSLTTDSSVSASASGQIASTGGGQAKRHFDTFETQFFQQGDADSTGIAGEVEHFDDLDDQHKRRRLSPSRQFIMGVGVGSTCIAIIGCIALWRSSNNSKAAVALASAPPAQVEPANPVAAPPPVKAEPALANPAAAAAPADPAAIPAQADPVPSQPAPAVAEAVPSQPGPAPAPAAPTVAPTPAQPAPAVAPAPTGDEKPQPALALPAKPEAAPAAAEPKPSPTTLEAAPNADAQARCKKAIGDKRNKEILAACPDAFAADSSAADIAVALAKIEFDRGRSAQAASWGQKAIAADPNAADAYVFIGGAEQSAGHRKAAKEAYKHYLQLAPTGRYASDLRAIVGSL